MAEQIKELIEKIQQEGIQAAKDKAQEIEKLARKQADSIVADAKLQASRLIEDAKEETQKTKDSTDVLLKQAARDMLLMLRKEVNNTLDRIVTEHLRQVLEPQELIKIIATLAKSCADKSGGDIVVLLSKQDLKKIEDGFKQELKEKIKSGLTIHASDDIHAGFTISYDNGKSQFDFSDKALAEYIGNYLKPRLAEFLLDKQE